MKERTRVLILGDDVDCLESIDAESEWVGMPEFVQDKKEPYAKLVVRFESESDLQEFAKLINQKLTKKTKSTWHPFKPHRRSTRMVYVNEK